MVHVRAGVQASGVEETHMIEKTLNAREYYILLKQRDPERCTISKTLSCFIWGTNCARAPPIPPPKYAELRPPLGRCRARRACVAACTRRPAPPALALWRVFGQLLWLMLK